MARVNLKIKYPVYYRVTDEDGTPRLETVFEKEALEFVSKAVENGTTVIMETVPRG